jgi:UDP-N-acetylmuramate dehydrogenase
MLPPVRGSLVRGAPLKDLVWFRAGGPAEILFRPADMEDLADFFAAKPADLRVCVIGVGSNLLVRDGGAGVVVRLSSASEDRNRGCGCARRRRPGWRGGACCGRCRHRGLEFLRGVPGPSAAP